MNHVNISKQEEAVLEKFGFRNIPFEKLQSRLKHAGCNPDSARTRFPVEHPSEQFMQRYPEEGTEKFERYRRTGKEAIQRGEVAVTVLNGGMATRFGGVPKGVVPVVNGRSFLYYKLMQIEKAGAQKTPAVLMNSFATAKVTREHLDDLKLNLETESFNQFVSMRMTQDGELFYDREGRLSLYAPGHGDFPFAMKESGLLSRLKNSGTKYVTLSNVDNLGASLDPVIVGMHIEGGNPLSVELVKANTGDVGGFPAFVNGKVVIMEAFRLPEEFDTDTISVFNTNSFIFDTEALDSSIDLDWFMVKKKIGEDIAIQWERLVGQMTEFTDVNWLFVPREGKRSRFIPIKTREDIDLRQEELIARLKALDVL